MTTCSPAVSSRLALRFLDTETDSDDIRRSSQSSSQQVVGHGRVGRQEIGQQGYSLGGDSPGTPGGQSEAVGAAGDDASAHGGCVALPLLRRPLLLALLQGQGRTIQAPDLIPALYEKAQVPKLK